MKERLERSEGMCEIGLPRVDEAALLIAAAEAGVTVMAMVVLRIGGLLGALEAAGARGVAEESLIITEPLGCSLIGECGRDGRFMTFKAGVVRRQIYSARMARGIVDREHGSRPSIKEKSHQGCLVRTDGAGRCGGGGGVVKRYVCKV